MNRALMYAILVIMAAIAIDWLLVAMGVFNG